MDILRLQNLSKYYTSSTSVVMGLSGINLSFSAGEFVAITGESGSGKSTLAHVLGGILPYESGELYINGQPTSHYDSSDRERYRRDLISFISQNYGILPGNTVLENVECTLRLGGMEREEAAIAAKKILEEVELSEFQSRRAGKLSSGQKQRLSIARALAKPSKILIADEPTGNLDKENSEKIIRLLKHASRDRLVILITHEFEEVKDVATRRIVLSDGAVITDARLNPLAVSDTASVAEEQVSPPQKEHKSRKLFLAPYITALTAKSRPIFSAILCLFLALTTFMTFVFLGNFIVALDDTTTKIYDSNAFANGDSDRIVIMRQDGSPMGEEDYDTILSVPHTENLETWGYINDINYYYRENVDYRKYTDIVNGSNYHPVYNPDDYQVTNLVEFIETKPLYLRTVPVTNGNMLMQGRLPESFYEVVSADPNYRMGDTVEVYIRNKTYWNISAYLCITVEVVGESNIGEGLYFSRDLGAMMNHAAIISGHSLKGNVPYVYMPYHEQYRTALEIPETSKDHFMLNDGEFLFPAEHPASNIDIGSKLNDLTGANSQDSALTCAGFFKTSYTRNILVTESTFDALTSGAQSDQISLYIKDYAYADRVMDDLGALGYLSVSPFRLGATRTNRTLATERLVTLALCLGALLLTFILQLVLLRAMFSSLYEHFRLLSNIGLIAKTAYISLAILFLLYTLAGEVLGGSIILTLNSGGVIRVINIFKYLDVNRIALLFAAHFVSVIFSYLITMRALRRVVFSKTAQRGDIDFASMEVEGE